MACAALVLAAAAAAHAAPKRTWEVVVLPMPTEFGGTARAINNRGDVAGTIHVETTRPHGAFWSNGVMTDLSAGSPTFGVANEVNDHGVVFAMEGAALFLWKDGVRTPLGIVGEPLGINKSGGAVGYYYPSGEIARGPQVGFYYENGLLHDIGSLGNNLTAAIGVNDKGVVVGYSRLPFSSTDHAVVWQNGVLRDLGTLGGTNSYAGIVTNDGVIYGSADAADGKNHLVAWDLEGRLLKDYGPRLSMAAINQHGAIVGNNLDTGKPFLLEDGVYTWLLDEPSIRASGLASFSPTGMNDRGSIVGIGWRPGAPSGGLPVLLVPQSDGVKPRG
jgi:probable HAF family extracellular repeat protein